MSALLPGTADVPSALNRRLPGDGTKGRTRRPPFRGEASKSDPNSHPTHSNV